MSCFLSAQSKPTKAACSLIVFSPRNERIKPDATCRLYPCEIFIVESAGETSIEDSLSSKSTPQVYEGLEVARSDRAAACVFVTPAGMFLSSAQT